MKAFLKIIRWPNLCIVILTMVLMRYAILQPVLSNLNVALVSMPGTLSAMTLQFPLLDFILLVCATVLITAAGYVINDYFDIKTDLINRGKVIVGTSIPRRLAMMWHNILNIAGVSLGFYISWKTGYFWMGILFLLVSGMLYFYSASYKRQFLVGNIIVAVLTAMVPMLVVIYEAPALYRYYTINALQPPDLTIIFYWVGGFAIFAFLTTLTREIIKDIEDFEGDIAYGRNTIPVVIGILTSKIVSVCLVLITIALLYITWFLFVPDTITLIYISFAIVAPLVFVIYQLIISKSRKQLHSASRLMKIVMLTGIMYSVVVKLVITYNIL
jgi:4-hydroxybenzoate polyprenyltransferase